MAIGDAPKPKTPEESLEQVILSEINQQKKPEYKTESKWSLDDRISYYLNNFYTRLPSTTARDSYEHRAIIHNDADELSRVFEDRKKKYKEWGKKPGESTEDEENRRGNVTKRRWEETDEQFFDSIDLAIEQAGVDRQKLLEYINVIASNHHKYDPQIERKLLFPIYVKLREMGYSHTDLTR